MKSIIWIMVSLISLWCILEVPVEAKTVNIVVVGAGQVGTTLLDQIEENQDKLIGRYGLTIHLVGVTNSKTMCLRTEGIPLKEWRKVLAQTTVKMDPEQCVKWISTSTLPNLILVDCTSSQQIADLYQNVLQAGVSIVTPNKKGNSGKYEVYKTLKELSSGPHPQFHYDANVGAGLPVITTVNELMRSGDDIIRIEGIFSGTLSYLFNTFGADLLFSDVVREAQIKGYTEPDPRDDLNGMDVARKLLILAREAGYPLEMSDVEIKPFLPQECFSASSVAEFYIRLKTYDRAMTQMAEEAYSQGKRLRYVATFEKGKATVSLQMVRSDHPFFHLSGNDNIAAFTTKNYSKSPLVIKGPGAGNGVTAAKVLEGIIRIGLNL